LSTPKPQIKGEVMDRFVVVKGDDAIALRQLGYYGEVGDRGEVVLDPVEAAYLLERDLLVVEIEGKQLSFAEFSSLIMSKDPKFLAEVLDILRPQEEGLHRQARLFPKSRGAQALQERCRGWQGRG